MSKIIIADDDDMIRRGIAKTLQKNCQFPLEIIFASNGNEVVELAQSEHPDVIVTDIRMPYCDGLQAIELIRSKGMWTPFVVISGYSDFEYAKRALKCGAVDYLLKPVSEEELVDVINKSVAIGDTAAPSEPYQVQMRRILHFMANHEDFTQYLSFQDIHMVSKYYAQSVLCAGILLHTGEQEGGNESLFAKLQSKIDAMPHTDGVAVLEKEHIVVLVSSKKPYDDLYNAFRSLHREKIPVAAGISDEFEDIALLSKAVTQARQCLSLRLYHTSACPLSYAELCRYGNTIPDSVQNEKLANAVTFLQADSAEDARKPILSVLDNLLSLRVSPPAIRAYLDDSIGYIVQLNSTDVMCDGNVLNVLYDRIRSLPFHLAYPEFTDLISKYIQQYWSAKEAEGDGKTRTCILMAKRFIGMNLKHDLSLSIVAEQLQLNPAYFSSLFKKETGMNFTAYVIKKRIDSAMVLLRTHPELKIYEIADRVGYDDIRYFGRVFKEQTGVSPARYRNSI